MERADLAMSRINSRPCNPRQTRFLLQFVDIPHTEFGELGTKTVEIQAQFAGLQTLAGRMSFSKSSAGKPGNLCGGLTLHYDHPIAICDDHVARTHPRAGTNDRHVD